MNDLIMKLVGFGNVIKSMESSQCSWCWKSVNPDTDFRDDISEREYKISGLCQSCQDKIYGV